MHYGFYKNSFIKDKRQYYTTSMFNHFAKRHCAFVTLLNVLVYYDLKSKDLIDYVYKLVGNGPILFMQRKIKRLFNYLNIDIDLKKIYRKNTLIKTLKNDDLVMVLLMRHIFDWHWVLTSEIKDDELTVINAWNTKPVAYQLNQGSRFIYAIRIRRT